MTALGSAQVPIGASRLVPNLAGHLDRPLRYHPEGPDFVIENGTEFFNRSLYGGNTAFRVDGGDQPEFLLYLPGRGGNLRLGVRTPAGAKWLQDATRVITRYRPGELRYEIRDPLLGKDGVLRVTAIAYFQTEGLIVRAEAESIPDDVELVWAYGGITGERGVRDGDIGTEKVPIGEYFQLRPEFCRDNAFVLTKEGFTLTAKAATIVGVVPPGARLAIAEAAQWNALPALLADAGVAEAREPVVVGRVALAPRQPRWLSLQRTAADAVAAEELATYREVRTERENDRAPAKINLAPAYRAEALPRRFAEAEDHFSDLRRRVAVDTPDPFLNAAVGALNVAADAVWDEPQQAIMHGAIAWRSRLLGWRGPYLLDALGWHERARRHFTDWASRQNTDPIPDQIPPPDEAANLARNEAGLHTNGDLSQSHYDMNLVFIDALFRHLRWTGDLRFAEEMWPTIERHLAWERRLFRRAFGPEKLPLYEAYAAIWASDDLQYSGGGAMHASAYNYFHNREAARLARALKKDPSPYEREAAQLARAMRAYLWLEDRGGFAEAKDWLGRQGVHPSAALWTFYHAVDSGVPTPREAWRMMRRVDTEIPHLPVRGPDVPEGLYMLATTNWMPYEWSINNVVMAETVHTALGFWQAGRPEEAWTMTKGALLAAMFMGISPGNVGSTSYLDVYRRESQRDFADGSGVLSRALIEGLFGVRPDALAGELLVEPGFPAAWAHASLRHPDVTLRFERNGKTDTYAIGQRFSRTLAVRLRLVARGDRVAGVTVDGEPARWRRVDDAVGAPRIEVLAPAAARHVVAVRWSGAVPAPAQPVARGEKGHFVRTRQGEMRWWAYEEPERVPAGRAEEPEEAAGRTRERGEFAPVELTPRFNDRVAQIFKNEYRSPRSPFVSLALPKQGLGGWAGGVNATAEIDDTGLRAAAASGGGRIVLPNGVPLATPGPDGGKNIVFTSQWDNYPTEVIVPLAGRARRIYLLMAGSTGPMQSRIDNGEVIVTYADGRTSRLALTNPTTWWPIEQDYFIDDFQFRTEGPLPVRVDLKTGSVRVLDRETFKGRGGRVPGGAATVLALTLEPGKELKTLTVRALANDVVIGLMAATLVR